jgi:hypothetical protein
MVRSGVGTRAVTSPFRQRQRHPPVLWPLALVAGGMARAWRQNVIPSPFSF